MEIDWPEYKLEELAAPSPNAMSTGPFGTAISSKYFQQEGVPVIRGSNLSTDVGIKMSDEGLVYVSEEKAEEFRRSIVREGDLVFTCWGTINQVGLITDSLRHKEYVISNKQMKFTPDRSKVDPLFLYYVFSSAQKQAEILQNGIGAAVPGFNLGQLKQHKIKLPTLYEQKRIAKILGAFDDKIGLDQQINFTLGSIAQALFKSWFVDFDPVIDNALAAGNSIPDELQARAAKREDAGKRYFSLPKHVRNQFPDHFTFTEELGWVPGGWEVSPLDDIISLTGGGTPKTSVEDYWSGDIPWFSVVDAPIPSDVFVIRTEKNITQAGLNNSSAKLLPEKTTIISARGTVGKCALTGRPMAMNQSCYGISGKNGIGPYFVYYTVLLRVAELQRRSHGSIFDTITRDTFKTIKLPVCPRVLTTLFDDTVQPFMDRILHNIEESANLSRLRDILLPRLLSGHVRLPTPDNEVAAVI